jgi:hypothetical protein
MPLPDTPLPTLSPSANSTQKTIEMNVDANALNLTLSALSAALGDIKVLKLTTTNKNSLKYEIIKDETTILKALEWIAKFGHGKIYPENQESPTLQYFILQQATTNMSAWNALIDRNLGKVPTESKIDLTATFDLAALGERAIEARKRQIINATPSLSVPSSWTTGE